MGWSVSIWSSNYRKRSYAKYGLYVYLWKHSLLLLLENNINFVDAIDVRSIV